MREDAGLPIDGGGSGSPAPRYTHAAADRPLPLTQALKCPRCDAEQQAFLRRLECSNGTFQVKWQCAKCGGSIGNPIARTHLPCRVEELSPWDKWPAEKRERERLGLIEASQRARAEELRAMRAKYQEYLASPVWKARRQAVLDREHGICQGCRAADAEEVHHLTYAHIRAELLFELVALCRSCHERIHGIEAPWALDGE